MSDPYSLLGVSPDADDAEVKKAYRALSKKFHPDNNPGDPKAEEKFKTVQMAYEQIMKQRKEGYSDYSSGFSGFSGFSGYANENRQYDKVEQDLRSAAIYIQNGYFNEAINVLESMTDRNSRWYYYSAIANVQTGNNIKGLEYARTALNMEPDNYDYRNLVESLENGATWYTGRTSQYNIDPSGRGNICMKIVIANIICNCCFGGGGMYCGNCLGGCPGAWPM